MDRTRKILIDAGDSNFSHNGQAWAGDQPLKFKADGYPIVSTANGAVIGQVVSTSDVAPLSAAGLNASTLTIWANGVISLGAPTAGQVSFMSSAPKDIFAFPGDFIATGFQKSFGQGATKVWYGVGQVDFDSQNGGDNNLQDAGVVSMDRISWTPDTYQHLLYQIQFTSTGFELAQADSVPAPGPDSNLQVGFRLHGVTFNAANAPLFVEFDYQTLGPSGIYESPSPISLLVPAGSTREVSDARTYTGPTDIYGDLHIVQGGSISSSSSVNLYQSGAVLDISNPALADASITELTGVAGSTIYLGSSMLMISQNFPSSFGGVISDGGAAGGSGGAIDVAGQAPLTLVGANTYTLQTSIQGELNLGRGGSVAASREIIIAGSGTFDVSGASAAGTVVIQNLSGDAGSTIKLGGGVLSVNEAYPSTYAGAITDGGVAGGVGGGLVVNGSAPLTLSGTDTFTGKTQIYGQLDLAGGAVLNQSKAVTLKSASAVFDISQATGKEAILNLAGVAGSHIHLGANTLKINDSTSATFSGVISDGGAAGGVGGALIVKGAASLNLTGTNTFTGGVTLQSGTLELGSPTAAGVGHALTFTGAATLQLDAGALATSGRVSADGMTLAGPPSPGYVYDTAIAGFLAGDHIDLASLTYTAGAVAIYNGSTLTVASGGSSVALTLTGFAAGTGFSATADGHGHVLVGLVGG